MSTTRDTAIADSSPRPRVDRHGDLLPPSALIRYGTPRFRQGDTVTDLTFAPDNQTLATTGLDHKVRLWEAATGKLNTEIAQEWATCVAFAADGKSLAVGSGIGTLRLFDLDGKELRKFAGHPARIRTVAFSSNGELLASAGADHLIKIWDASTGRELRTLDGHQGQVYSLAFVPGASLLVSGAGDRSIRIWNAADGNLVRRIERDSAVRGIAVSADGKTIASAEDDKKLHLWNRADGKETKTFSTESALRRIAFASDNNLVAASGVNGTTTIWDLAADKKQRTLSHSEGGGGPITLSSDGKLIACAGDSAAVRIWDVKSGEELLFQPGHQAAVVSADLSPKGKLLVSADALGVVRIWDTETGRTVRKEQYPPPVALALDDEGAVLALATNDAVLLQAADTGKQLKVFRINDAHPLALTWTGTHLAVGYADSTIRLWDIEKGEVAQKLSGHNNPVVALAYSARSKTLGSADRAGQVRLWNDKGAELRRVSSIGPRPVIAFNPTGTVLAASNADGMISLWNVANGVEERQLQGHDSPVCALAFAPDGKTLVSAGRDHLVRLWELASAKQVLCFTGHAGPVCWVRFGGNGRGVYSGSNDCSLICWDLISKFEGMRVGPNELDSLWKELASGDGPPAYRATWTMVAAPKQAVPFVRERLRTFIGVDPQRISKLIDNLNDDDFMVRERATQELEKLGQLAENALQKTKNKTPDLEVLRRIERILEKQMAPDVSWSQERLRVLRAINVLEKIGTNDARTILESLADGAPEEVLMREARASLDRLNQR